jgi:hypothetical protein
LGVDEGGEFFHHFLSIMQHDGDFHYAILHRVAARGLRINNSEHAVNLQLVIAKFQKSHPFGVLISEKLRIGNNISFVKSMTTFAKSPSKPLSREALLTRVASPFEGNKGGDRRKFDLHSFVNEAGIMLVNAPCLQGTKHPCNRKKTG